ncbi:MAG: tetratricopeptide repeat protein [Kiritimatiellae bacterium]|nr:tetratricopeptide repeat protein [Kiritimatiellia bacterium]
MRREDEARRDRAETEASRDRAPAWLQGPAYAPVCLFLIVLATLLVYANTFRAAWHFDDNSHILQSRRLRDLGNFWPPSGTRYVGYLSFALNYRFGGLNVVGYHVVNTAVHAVNGVLVWWLVLLLFRTPRLAGAARAGTPRLAALTAGLLFVVHPVQTQAVTYIIQRFASMAALFYLLCVALYVKARLSAFEGRRPRAVLWPYLAALLAALLAMGAKEISVTLPVVLGMCEWVLFRAAPDSRAGRAPGLKRAAWLAPFVVVLVAIPLQFLSRDGHSEGVVSELQELTHETLAISRASYLMTQLRVLVTYLRLLALPVKQNFDYDYPVYRSVLAPAVWLSFILLAALFGWALAVLFRTRRRPAACLTLAAMGIVWFFVTLSVESSVIPIRDVIYEHRLYLPGFGVALAFAAGVFHLLARLGVKRVVPAAAGVLAFTVLPLGVAAHVRNRVWRDELTLWSDVVAKSPNKARPHNNLGFAHETSGAVQAAMAEYRQALALREDYALAHYNLGNIYEKLGRNEAAMDQYETAFRIFPGYAQARNNAGVLLCRKKRIEEAIAHFKAAVALRADYADAHNNLGSAYYMQGAVDEAIAEYRIAVALNPSFLEAHYNLGVLYGKKGLRDEAAAAFRTALRVRPDHAKARQMLEELDRPATP